MKCPNCGADIVAGQKFCNKCGFPIEKYANKSASKNNSETQTTNNAQATQPVSPVQPQPTQPAQPQQPVNAGSVNSSVKLDPTVNANQAQQPVQPQQNQQPVQPQQPVNPNQVNNGAQNFGVNNNYNAQPQNQQPNNFQNNQANQQNNFNQAQNQPNQFNQNQFAPGQNPGQNQNNFNQNFNQQNMNGQPQQPSNFQKTLSLMMPFARANAAISIGAIILLIIVAIFSYTFGAIVLIAELVGWYFLADKNKGNTTQLNQQISAKFSKKSSNNNGAPMMAADNGQTKKVRMTVIIAAAVSLLFLFVGTFSSVSLGNSDNDAASTLKEGLDDAGFSTSGTAMSFTETITHIGQGLDVAEDGSSMMGANSTSDDISGYSIGLRILEWVTILLPIVTLAFSFLKRKSSGIVRIISTALSTLILVGLGVTLIGAKSDGDSMASFGASFVGFGYSYYITLIASIVALVASIMWVRRAHRPAQMNTAQAQGNFQSQNMNQNMGQNQTVNPGMNQSTNQQPNNNNMNDF
ncbi:zinc ribbon domain-containing protein [Companilactobacillus ginsenosidimutans]|uniref:Zinc-ribbon domain-containing protein n=1 Tax=Companilactobacillus ginsenosidimutans TaxID=1007676 RepID=A0A0H4QMT5_9LACO|nr:zinc ribbon domain-containing protein [Companilactobacillus ginsenosidimutans]AKP68018.1 hypothetical protein ABM34_11065 [Companilactobacillus ginsenosidimutans]